MRFLIISLFFQPLLCAAHMVLQNLVGKAYQLLRRAVNGAEKPAFKRSGKRRNIKVGYKVNVSLLCIEYAYFRTDLFNGAVNYCIYIVLKEAP